MSTLSIGSVSDSLSVPRADSGRTASMLYVAIIAALSIFAFIEPIEYAWTRPTYDEAEDEERSEAGARDGSLQRQITLGSLGLFGIMTLALTSDKFIRVRTPLGILCVAYLAWCAASCAWSEELSMTLRRGIALTCEVLAGLAIAQRVSPRQFAWLIFTCTLSWLSLGLLAEVTQGALQPWQEGYRFKGIFHPNIMSVNCALLIMSSLYLSGGVQSKKQYLYAIAGIAFVFLLLTGSRTALGAVFASFAAVSLMTASGPKKALLAGFLGLALVLVALTEGLGAFDVSTDWISMGRQDHDAESLTGRVPLWTELLNVYVPPRLLMGYGYGAFWTPAHIIEVERSQGWSAPYAHSTYIDLLLSIGLIGTVLFLLIMILSFVQASRLEALHPGVGYGFIAMVIVCVLGDGVLETTFGSTWFMSFFGICAICYLLSYDPSRQPAPQVALNT